MSRKYSVVCSLLTGGLLLLGESALQAQQKGEANKISTVDGVKLSAIFYPSAKKNAATVIMLHPIGEKNNIKLDGWQKLAETLQENSFNVLAFDFRGHGDSKEVDPAVFWNFPANRTYVKVATKERDTIDYKDYKANATVYLPILINDIAAVKAFLDRKNDEGACSTASTIVIGADNGATLGAIWINSEWNRVKGSFNMFGQVQLEKRAEGNDIIGMVSLNIQPALGTRKLLLSSVLKIACKEKSMPAAFLYGEKDAAAKSYNKALVDALKVKGSKKHEGIFLAEVPNTNLSGVKLLSNDLMTDGFIAKHLADNVLAERKNEYEKRDFVNNTYYWRDPRTQQILQPANVKGEKLLKFDTYSSFMQ
jgi:hypothetical protein